MVERIESMNRDQSRSISTNLIMELVGGSELSNRAHRGGVLVQEERRLNG